MRYNDGKEVSEHGQAQGAGQGRVISPSDRLRGQLAGFRRRVAQATTLVRQAASLGRVGVAVSGGKDSTVTLALVRSVLPYAPAAFFDDGAQLRDTYDYLASVENLSVYPVEPDLIEMCKIGGYWGYQSPTPDVTFDFLAKLITEPARRFREEHNLAVVAMGLRAQESTGRWFNARVRGQLYYAERDGCWHLCPALWWSVEDVWAYIASHKLPYNRAYDKMASIGMQRREMRIGPVLGAAASQFGRYVYLKQIDPELWNRLANVFPVLRSYA